MILFSRSFIRKRVLSFATTASGTATSFALAQDPTSTGAAYGGEPAALRKRHGHEDDDGYDDQAEQRCRSRFCRDGDAHRQGAIDMAKDELKYGHNEQLRQLAWEIATNQQWEISGMRNSIGDKGSSATQLTEQLPRGLSSPQASPDSMVADGAVTPQ